MIVDGVCDLVREFRAGRGGVQAGVRFGYRREGDIRQDRRDVRRVVKKVNCPKGRKIHGATCVLRLTTLAADNAAFRDA